MSRVQWLVLSVLCLFTISSGVAVVYAKNQSRALFVALQDKRAEHDLEVMEWGRLQLELATIGGLQEVTLAAKERLQMRIPQPGSVVVID